MTGRRSAPYFLRRYHEDHPPGADGSWGWRILLEKRCSGCHGEVRTKGSCRRCRP